MSGSYSLATTVSFLERMLEVVGKGCVVAVTDTSRESLRARFRKAVRLLNRFKAEHESEQMDWSLLVASHHSASSLRVYQASLPISVRQVAQPGNVFTRKSQPASEELRFCGRAELCSSLSIAEHLDDLPAPAPFFAKTVATLDLAIRMGHDGLTGVYVAVIDLWSRRHDIRRSDAAKQQQPRHRRFVDRLYLALMRFVFGFFGSHKVDARNNP